MNLDRPFSKDICDSNSGFFLINEWWIIVQGCCNYLNRFKRIRIIVVGLFFFKIFFVRNFVFLTFFT